MGFMVYFRSPMVSRLPTQMQLLLWAMPL